MFDGSRVPMTLFRLPHVEFALTTTALEQHGVPRAVRSHRPERLPEVDLQPLPIVPDTSNKLSGPNSVVGDVWGAQEATGKAKTETGNRFPVSEFVRPSNRPKFRF